MGKKMVLPVLLGVLALILLLGGCQPPAAPGTQDGNRQMITVTDMLGREVELALPAERAVAIGPGALRLYCYVNGMQGLVGVEQMEREHPTGKPYLLAYPELTELPVIGPGGPNNAPDAEKIAVAAPDVIFSTYTEEAAAIDELQAKTGLPVVALSYGAVSVFDTQLYASLRLIGEVTGAADRAEQLVTRMEGWRRDLDERSTGIPESDRPRVYAGALSYRGAHGIESTQGSYPLFNAVNAVNVVDETGRTGSLVIDKEMLLQWDPEIIFIDYSGYALVQQDYRQNPRFYRALSAVQNSRLYAQLPYNYYYTNVGTAIANTYYIGKVLYPEQFADIDVPSKADEIYEALLGEALYGRMAADFGGLEPLALP